MNTTGLIAGLIFAIISIVFLTKSTVLQTQKETFVIDQTNSELYGDNE